MAMAVAPSLFVSTTVPDAFSAATDIAVSRNHMTNKELDAQFKFYLLPDYTLGLVCLYKDQISRRELSFWKVLIARI